MKRIKWSIWLLLPLAALLPACSMLHITDVNRAHSLLQSGGQGPQAEVYFIRPKTEHPQGYADNELQVDVDGEPLMTLGKAEYTLVHLKPRKITITLRNKTQVRGRWEVTTEERSRNFTLEPGETHYILTQPVDGEFRGVHFVAQALNKADAREAARYLTPVGEARQRPIDGL